jgi:pimeloyl-ACP methyl ester carboxylesterase
MTPATIRKGAGGTAVVLLHGVGGGKEMWPTQLDALAGAGYLAIAWDMPGYGETPAIAPYGMAGLADSLGTLLDTLRDNRIVLLGHSMGGMVAQEAYAAFPERIAGLILAGTSAAFGKPDGAWQQGFLRARLAPLDAGRTMAEIAPTLVAGMVGEAPDPAGAKLAVEIMSRVPGETYRAALGALLAFDRRGALPGIRVPVLLIAGERDPNAPPDVMRKMEQAIPGAEYVELAGCGHLACLEQPAAFNDAVLEFLARRFASPAT